MKTRKRSRITSLVDMLEAGKYDWVDGHDINSKNFRVKPKLFTTEGSTVLDLNFRRPITTEKVLAELGRFGLRPATIEELLAFGARYPREQRRYPIVALGSYRRLEYDYRGFPYLSEGDHERFVSLTWKFFSGNNRSDKWKGSTRFLAYDK